MSSYELGTGHLAVVPTMKGFRKTISRETSAAARGFGRQFARSAGGSAAGRGFGREFARSAGDTASRGVQAAVRKASDAVAKARDVEARAAGQLRVAETALADARSRYAAGSVQVVRAEERAAEAKRRHIRSTAALEAATGKLSQAQAHLAKLSEQTERKNVFRSLAREVPSLVSQSQLLGRHVSIVQGLLGRASSVGSRFGSVVSRSFSNVLGRARSFGSAFTSSVSERLSGSWVGSFARSVSSAAGVIGRTLLPAAAGIGPAFGRAFSAAASAAANGAASIAASMRNVIGGGAAAVAAAVGASLAGGFSRLAAVETAEAKMRGFGLESETITRVMGDVKDAVAGTVYTVGDMGNAAAAALVAGVKPGEQLSKYMETLKNTATGTGRPLKEIQSIMGKVVAGQAAYTTELMQLQDSGIPVFTLLSQKLGKSVAEIKDMASSGEITADVLIDTLGDSMGAMAESVGSTTESMLLRMRSSFARFGEELMRESFPYIGKLAGAVKSVMDLLIAVMPGVKAAFGFDDLSRGLTILDGFIQKVDAVTASVKNGDPNGVVAGVVEKVRELAPLLGLAAAAALPMMGSFLSGLPMIGQLFAGLGPGMLAGLGPLLAGGGLVALLGLSPEAFSGVVSSIVGFMSNELPGLLSGALESLSGLLPGLASNFAANLPTLIQGVLGALDAVIAALVQALPGLVQAVVAAVPMIITALVNSIPVLVQGALQLFLGLVQGLGVALPQIIVAIFEAIPVLVTSLIEAMPVLIQGGLQLFLGLIDGLGQAIPLIVIAIIEAIPVLVTAIASALPQIISAAVQMFIGLITGLVQVVPHLVGKIIEVIPQLVGALLAAVPQFLQAGVDLIAGLARGIWQAGGMIIEALGELVGGAIGWVKDLLGIHSPSRVFMGIGNDLGAGFALGIESMQGQVRSAAGLLADAAVDAFDKVEAPVIAAEAELRASSQRAGRRNSAGDVSVAAGRGAMVIEQHVHAAAGMSESTVAEIAARRLDYELRGVS